MDEGGEGSAGKGRRVISPLPQEAGQVESLLEEGNKYYWGFELITMMINQDLTDRRQKDGKRGDMCSRNTRSGPKDGGGWCLEMERKERKSKLVRTKEGEQLKALRGSCATELR